MCGRMNRVEVNVKKTYGYWCVFFFEECGDLHYLHLSNRRQRQMFIRSRNTSCRMFLSSS